MNDINQITIERTYQVWAKLYEWLVPVYLLGNEGRLRQETIRALELHPGQAVLDVGCGTGRNFPFILEKIGATGSLVGVDYTPAMLEEAGKRVARRGWGNVQLVQADASKLNLEEKFDAALSTLAMSVIPDYKSALERMRTHLVPGGHMAIADAKRSTRRYARPFNFVADLLGWGAAADMTRPIWTDVEAQVDDYFYREWFMGFFYVAAGRIKE
jgi:ubiquinone/menaquinone biosynthesis C-methylase UbiE